MSDATNPLPELIMRRIVAAVAASLAFSLPAVGQTAQIFGLSQAPNTIPTLVLNGSVTTAATDMGWWREFESTYSNNNPDSDNHLAGNDGEEFYRPFFLFNVPTGFVITSAVLRVKTYEIVGTPHLSLWNYTGTLNALQGPPELFDDAVYNDLGTGIFYGARTFQSYEGQQVFDIELNKNAVSVLNESRGSEWVVGGSVTNGDVIEQPPESVVPEPGTVVLLGGGLAGLMVVSHRKRRI